MQNIDGYFDWLVRRVFGASFKARMDEYSMLVGYLFVKGYWYRLPMDRNRFSDGVSMRWKYHKETGNLEPEMDSDFCSMLEMMAGLAYRCEIDIMWNDTYGDRTREWFWKMICSLGLDHLTNDIFTEEAADAVVDRFLNGEYGYDGEGGLFSFDRPHFDIHRTELWKQLQWFLAEQK